MTDRQVMLIQQIYTLNESTRQYVDRVDIPLRLRSLLLSLDCAVRELQDPTSLGG